MVNLNDIAVFVRVIESGSFSGAARLMGLPRSTVSRKVSQLEEALEVRLIQRSTRKLNLTHIGRDYFVKCQEALCAIEQANLDTIESQKVPSGTIRISSLLAAQNGFLCDWINDFLQRYPEVKAEIILSDGQVDMIESGIDVAFRAGALTDSSLVARRLVSTELILCASDHYLSNAPVLKSVDDLKNHSCITVGLPPEAVTWQLHDNDQQVTSVAVQSKVMANSIEFAVNACIAGNGIGLLPDALVQPLIQDGKICRVLQSVNAQRGGLYVVYPSRTHLSTTVRTFIDFITTKANEDKPWQND